MPGLRPAILAALTVLVTSLAAADRASALTLRPCPGQRGFGCGTLRVPLDRSGVLPGTLGLRVAVEDSRAARRRSGVLVALSGGPGQDGVSASRSFAGTLAPLLRTRRLVTLDQRGTGGSGALNCPGVQGLSGIDPFTPAAVRACALRVGPRRRVFSTQDTVADLEALRQALGVPKLAVMGVSYGTYVAQQYARVHPDRTERLVLDSVVSPEGVDPFLLDTFARAPRVLREQCARGRCDGVTADPVADVAALVPRLEAGSITARAYDPSGRRVTRSLRTGEQLFFALIAGDLNPYLQAALPGAIAAARAGDPAALVRLLPVAAGGPTPRRELSAGLNVITGCEDARLPYALSAPPADRDAQARAALASLDPASYAPWDAGSSSYVDDCLAFPGSSTAPSQAPLPPVPTLVLSGRLDLRTPAENGDAILAGVPGAQRVTVGGVGHDVLDSDLTGCAERALGRWSRGRPATTACAGSGNQVVVLPRPPRGLGAYRSIPGIAGDRGRVLLAVLDTAQDARVALLQRLYAGLGSAGGGLRGGRFSAPEDLSSIRLAGYSYLRGLRVTGRLTSHRGTIRGTLAVRAPHGLSGRLRLTARGASGTLGGRPVRFTESGSGASRVAGRAPRMAPRAAELPLPRATRIVRP